MKPKPDPTAAKRQREQTVRDRAAGITRVTVKVPAEAIDRIKQLAAELRGEPSGRG